MRRTFIMLVTGLALFSLPRSASAQVSIWLQKGVSGAGAAVFVSENEDQTTYGVNAGYSYRGFVELDFTAAYLTFPEDPLPADLVGLVIVPRVELHPLKQGPGMPISVGIGTGLARFFFASEEFDSRGISIDSWNFIADASIYRFFKVAPRIGITPAVAGGYIHSWSTLTQFGDEVERTTDDSFSLATGAYVAYLDDAGRIWGIAPVLDFGEVVTVSLRAGVVWTL